MGQGAIKLIPPQNDKKLLHRRRALFTPLAQNRRLKVINYLVVAGNQQSIKSAQAFKACLHGFDYDLQNAQLFDNFEKGFQGKQFSEKYTELISDEKADGFIIYFAGDISPHNFSMIIDHAINCYQKSNKFSTFHEELSIENFFKEWIRVKQREKKHLLLILESPQSECLQLKYCEKNPEPFCSYEDHFGIEWKNSNFVLRKDPTFSIIASPVPLQKYQNQEEKKQYQPRQRIWKQLPEEMKIKYELVAPFTSIFCEYILQASSNHLDDLARVKGVTESNKSTIMPYFFGFEVKAYFDFGIYFWVLPSQMINQLDVNSFISSWMPLKGDIPEQAEEQEQKLLYPSPKGEYFGFVSKCNLSGQLFGNPQIGSKIKLQYKEANQEIFTMKFGEQRLLNSNNSNFVNKSNIFDKTNPFKSSIIEDTFFDDQIMRKYCGYQQYGLDTDDNFEVYEGYWKNDLFSYQGCFRFSNGARYEGGYKKGKKHGYGVYYSQLGPIYAGQFVYNQIQGIGKLILDENQIYYGTFHNGMRNGFGELYYEKDNEVMLMWGQWENNKQQGHGKTALSSLPHIYMKANYENDEIEGDVIFNVTESSQHSNEEKRIFQYKAIWINSRRVTPYILVSKSTKSKEENRQILIHQKSLEQFEALYNSFKYSIISVARDIGKCKNNKNY